MSEVAAASAGGVTVEHHLLAEVVTRQLEAMLSVGNYDAVKLLLEPVQPVDIAEAIGNLPQNLQAIELNLQALEGGAVLKKGTHLAQRGVTLPGAL